MDPYLFGGGPPLPGLRDGDTVTARKISNRYAAPCHRCGQTVAPGEGVAIGTATGQRTLTRDGWRHVYRWRTEHAPKLWHGSPVSGRWVGGCPIEITPPQVSGVES